MLRGQTHRQHCLEDDILRIEHLLLRLHGHCEQRQDKETVIHGLVPHIGYPLLRKGIVAPSIIEVFPQRRSAVALHEPGSEYLMLGLHVPVPMVYGHDNLLVHNVISSFPGTVRRWPHGCPLRPLFTVLYAGFP